MTDNHKSRIFRFFFEVTRPPSILDSVKIYFKKLGLVITGAVGAIIITLFQIYVQSPPLKIVILSVFAFIIFTIIVTFIIYLFNFRNYMVKLEEKDSGLRSLMLMIAQIDPLTFKDDPLEILGITSNHGTVNLVLKSPKKNWLLINSLLDVMTITKECWGTIKVVNCDKDQIVCEPINRINPAFWESLEDRMYTDPSPPASIHLEPFTPIEIKEIFGDQLSKEESIQ